MIVSSHVFIISDALAASGIEDGVNGECCLNTGADLGANFHARAL